MVQKHKRESEKKVKDAKRWITQNDIIIKNN